MPGRAGTPVHRVSSVRFRPLAPVVLVRASPYRTPSGRADTRHGRDTERHIPDASRRGAEFRPQRLGRPAAAARLRVRALGGAEPRAGGAGARLRPLPLPPADPGRLVGSGAALPRGADQAGAHGGARGGALPPRVADRPLGRGGGGRGGADAGKGRGAPGRRARNDEPARDGPWGGPAPRSPDAEPATGGRAAASRGLAWPRSRPAPPPAPRPS